jgi:hypothetical protein
MFSSIAAAMLDTSKYIRLDSYRNVLLENGDGWYWSFEYNVFHIS